MFVLVFTVGSVNILLGYALAFYLRLAMDRWDKRAALSLPGNDESLTEAKEPAITPEPEVEVAWKDDTELAAIEVTEAIPPEWVDRLAKESMEAKSLVEAMAQVLRLEVNKYREALVCLEEEMRQHGPTAAQLSKTIQRLVKLNRQWLAVQAGASGHLNQRLNTLGKFDEIAASMDKTLLDQQSQIESTCNNLTSLDVSADLAGAYKTLVNEFTRLANMSHQLRDGIGQALLTVLHSDNRLDVLQEMPTDDPLSGFRNHAGFEIEMAKWLTADPGRQRLASALLVDLSEVGSFNRQCGTRFGDRLMAAAASLLSDVMRKNRGFEIAARVRGQQFLFFFGDTGPRGATSAAERMRQSFAGAEFEYGDQNVEVRVSCAVCEFQSQDDTLSLLERLEAALQAAKQQGGDCTMLDEGEGPQPVKPPDYQLPQRVITIE